MSKIGPDGIVTVIKDDGKNLLQKTYSLAEMQTMNPSLFPQPEQPQIDKEPAVPFGIGAEVTVRRSSGEYETGWSVTDIRGRIVTVRRGNEVKQYSLRELRQLNRFHDYSGIPSSEPQPFAIGTQAIILRSDGNLEDGWRIQQIAGDQVTVEKDGLGKTLTMDKFRALNPDLVYPEKPQGIRGAITKIRFPFRK